MEHTQEEWIAIELELQILRSENKALKLELEQIKAKDQEAQNNLIRSSVQPYIKKAVSKQFNTTYCKHCQPKQKTRQELVNELQSWSSKLTVNLFKKKQTDIRITNAAQSKDSPIKEAQISIDEEGLLQKICLFGPNEAKTIKISAKKMFVPHQLYYPTYDPLFSLYQSYGYSLYPETVEVKAIRQKNKGIQVDRIIFRKNLKPPECKLIIFQSKQEFQPPKNRFRRQYNPFGTIYCVSIQFQDYLYSDQEYQGFVDRTMSMMEEPQAKYDQRGYGSPNKQKTPQILRRQSSVGVYGQTSIYKSGFNLTVMSFYPFIDFFWQFLQQLVNYLKIKRIQEHSKYPNEHQQVDIKSVVKQLQQAKSLFDELFSMQIELNTKYHYQLGQSTIKLDLSDGKIKQELSRDWAYRILKLLDKDTLYQIYCLVLQEESIVFFCQQSFILTFVIHLFVSLLMQPFSYPHTIVSSVFELDHLETPFIGIMGLNKPFKWLSDNEEQLIQKISGKILICISEDEVKIKNRKKQKIPKSDKLRKIFSSFYKRAQKIDSKKKDILTRQITKQQNELTVQLLTQLQTFYKQELLRYFPNEDMIKSIRRDLLAGNQNMAASSVKLLRMIEHLLAQARKKIQKDPVVEMITQKQIFSVFLTIHYDIA